MSNRALKKIREQQQKLLSEVNEEEVQDVYEQELQKKKKNFFKMMQNKQSESEEEEQEEKQEQTQQTEQEEENKQVQNKEKKNKKKKNKKKKDEKPQEEPKDEDIEFLEKQIEQKPKEESKTQEPLFEDGNVKLFGCLDIVLSKLNYNKELQKYFKKAKLTSDSDIQRQKNQLGRGKKSQIIRQHKLVHNQEVVVPLQHKFQCEPVDLNDFGLKVYKFVASPSYESTQKEYETVKNSLDPQAIFDFSQYHPQHCQALFDMSEYFRLKGDYGKANYLLEMLIYIYEESLGYEFGKVFEDPVISRELEYSPYSNTFLMTLFKFTDILGKKGCYRSALEFTKVLIKLCPSTDPAGALMLLDYHCLSASQYSYLVFFTQNFAKEVYKHQKYSLAFMPNYLYSCAIAKFLKRKGEVENDAQLKKEFEKNLDLTEEDFQKAITNFHNDPLQQNHNVLMIQAILMFPSALLGLAKKNEYAKQHVGNVDEFKGNQRKHLKELLELDFLQRETHLYWFLGLENDDDAEGLKKVIDVFVEKNKILWKHSYIAQWIKGIIGLIQNKIEDKTLDLMQFYQSLSYQEENKPPANIIPFQFRRYKSLVKTHFSDQTERLDFNQLFADNIGAHQQFHQVNQPRFNPINPNQGILGVLLNSLLPWVHNPVAQQQQQQQQQFQEDEWEQLPE